MSLTPYCTFYTFQYKRAWQDDLSPPGIKSPCGSGLPLPIRMIRA
jgi:hypothetical protein